MRQQTIKRRISLSPLDWYSLLNLKTKNIVNPTVPKVTSSRFVHACSFSCLLELQEATEKCSTMCGLLVQF